MKRTSWLTLCSVLVVTIMVFTSCGATATPTAAPTTKPTAAATAVPPTAAPTVAAAATATKPPAATAAPTTPPATAAPVVKKGGTLVLAGHQEITGFSPDDITAGDEQYVLIMQILNPLVQLDTKFNVINILAESYTMAPDGLTYTFKLRKGVKFQDGTTFTSKDVKYTYDYYRDPKNAASIAGFFTGLGSVETPDDYTVVCKMSELNITFLLMGATVNIVPAAYHSKVGEEKFRTAPIGTGAFKLKEWIPAEHTTLEAFADHFRGRPILDAVRMDIIPEASVRAIAMQSGAAQASVWPFVAEDNLKFAADTKNYTVYRLQNPSINRFNLNVQSPVLSDKAVRQAMMYAIDRQQVINDVFKGTATVANSMFMPSFTPWYKDSVKKYEYSVAKSTALLDGAGWKPGASGIREKNGTALRFTCMILPGDQARKPEAELVQQFLKKVGIDMQIQEMPLSAIMDGMKKGTVDASLFNWSFDYGTGDPDPSDSLASWGSSDFMRYNNPRAEQLMKDGLKELDPAKRKAIYDELQDIFVDDVPVLYMMYWDWFTVFSSKVQGLPKDAGLFFWAYEDMYKWWLSA